MDFQLLDVIAALEAPDGVVALPVDHCYMLAGRPEHVEALARMRRITAGRKAPEQMILIGRERAAFLPYVQASPDQADALMTTHWPAPLIVCMTHSDRLLQHIHQGTPHVGLMQPQSGLLLDLLSMVPEGVLAVLEAARFGDAPAHSAMGVYNSFGEDVDCVLSADDELVEQEPQTRVLVANDGGIHLLRSGRIVLD